MQKGRVVGHSPMILLTDCRFVVRPAGHARVLREGRKNVHAFVVGHLGSLREEAHTIKIRYNPRECGSFRTMGGRNVNAASLVILDNNGIRGVGLSYAEESSIGSKLCSVQVSAGSALRISGLCAPGRDAGTSLLNGLSGEAAGSLPAFG